MMDGNGGFVRVGDTILNIDMITSVHFEEDGRIIVTMTDACEDGQWWFKDLDAEELRALFLHVRTAGQIAASRQPQVEPDRQTLLMLVRDAAEIIKAYDVAWVGHVDSSDTGEWLDRAQYVLGLAA
jgi:hypothetical protein